MMIHRDQRRVDTRDVLDEFEKWLLRERSAQERTAAAYTARVAGFVEWLPERGNSAAIRNARRAALRSFFTYASYRAPDAIATIEYS